MKDNEIDLLHIMKYGFSSLSFLDSIPKVEKYCGLPDDSIDPIKKRNGIYAYFLEEKYCNYGIEKTEFFYTREKIVTNVTIGISTKGYFAGGNFMPIYCKSIIDYSNTNDFQKFLSQNKIDYEIDNIQSDEDYLYYLLANKVDVIFSKLSKSIVKVSAH
ncbi:MAG: hypothetical protein AAGI37_05905 [Planctomycetota bacterium]